MATPSSMPGSEAPLAAASTPSAAPTSFAQGPSKSVLLFVERQAVYETLTWVPAGGGLRFSRDIPLRVLPPGEPIHLEVIAHNQGGEPLSVSYYVSLTNANLQGTRLQGEAQDIPAGSVLDVTHTLAANLMPGDYHITVFCLPRTPTGKNQDPSSFPSLAPVDGPIPTGLPSLYDTLKIREEVPCPSCGGNLLWTPTGMGGKPRAWVCGRCGHRIESGTL